MAIRLVSDVGAPLTVVAADLITEAYAPQANEWVTYLLAAGGYIAAGMGRGGDFAKNIGIAALPAAAKNIYERARGGTMSKKLAFKTSRRVSRYPASATEPEFRGVRLV